MTMNRNIFLSFIFALFALSLTTELNAQAFPSVSSKTVNNVSCYGGNDGSISISVTGGSGTYVTVWNTGALTNSISGLTAGTYIATITDVITGAFIVDVTNISQPLQINVSGVITDVNCFSASTGAIAASASGGNGNYTFSWSNGSNGSLLNNVTAGTYTVTATDIESCTGLKSFTIDQPNASLQSTESVSNALCNGSADGSIDLEAFGGTTPYTYSWSNGSSTEDIGGLPSGSYTFTITDHQGCTLSKTIAVSQPTVLSANSAVTDVSCFGDATGAIDLTPSGGTAPYSYSWANSQFGLPSTQDQVGILAENYTVTVTDDNGCTFSSAIIVNEPAELVSSIAVSNINCFGSSTGSLDLTVNGGTPGFNYSWQTGSGAPAGSTQDLTNVAANTYNVTVTDNNGCSTTNSGQITQPSAPLSTTLSITDVDCFGNATGAIDNIPTGGTTPYSYTWSNASVTQDIANISAGNYALTITDANNCTLNESAVIQEPSAPLSETSSITDVDCFGNATGAIDITASGGTSPYAYQWESSSFALGVSQDISSLESDNYAVTITDANNCTLLSNFTVTEPSELTSSISGTNITCFGLSNGIIDLTVSGGIPGYSYNWSNNAGAYPSVSQDLVNIPADNYNVTVTDNNGCVTNESITLSQPAAPVSGSFNVSNVSCFGDASGALDLTPNGGTAPYTYFWDNSATTQDLSGLTSGTYNVTISDVNGCTANYSNTINQPAAPVNLTFNSTDVDCNGNTTGSIDLTASGGTSPYNYNWQSTPYTLASNQDQTNLAADVYSTTVTDANGCQESLSITITEPAALQISSNITDVTCFGFSNGLVDVTVSGGVPGYNYNWTNGSGALAATSQDLPNVEADQYTVTVTDQNNCAISLSSTVNQPSAPLSASWDLTDVACNGEFTGEIDVTAAGGTPNYSYLWNTGVSDSIIQNIAAGVYNLTVTDQNNCSANYSIPVQEPAAPLTATYLVSDVDCNGNTTGSIDLTPAGGTTPYSYNWQSSSFSLVTSQDLASVGADNYSITITDSNLCSWNDIITVNEPTALTSSITGTAVNCFGGSDGSVDFTIAGGTIPYAYSWTLNGNPITNATQDLTNVSAGFYTVIATDANGCSISETFEVTEPSAPLAGTVSITDVLCNGDATGEIALLISGGTTAYTYNWSNGGGAAVNSNLTSGSYTITVTDDNNCTWDTAVTVNQPLAPLTNTVDITHIDCNGNSTGAIDISPIGGTTPYTYNWFSSSFNLNNTQDQPAVLADTYEVTITDANNCTLNETYVVTEPPLLTASGVVTDVLCNADSTGNIDVTVNGGTLPYAFNWNNNTFTTEDLINFPAGQYDLEITDDSLCAVQLSFEIEQPLFPLTSDSIVKPLTCFESTDGTIEYFVNGGTAPYNYQWSNGDTTSWTYNLSSGNYLLTVTDFNGCTLLDTTFVDQPDDLVIAETITPVTCHGDENGAIDLLVTGENGAYQYQWADSSLLVSEFSNSITNYPRGVYTVTVTDSVGCFDTAVVFIPEPEPWDVEYTIQDVACFGGSDGAIYLDVAGNTSPYNFNWSNGETNQDLINVTSGEYSVLIEDQNLCDTTIFAFIETPDSIQLTVSTTGISCKDQSDGTATASAFGGSDGFIYDWSNGEFSAEIDELEAGLYTVTATDVAGCTAERTAEVQSSTEECIQLTNTFTPNGDGTNDTWFIENIGLYPSAVIQIFNKWGDLLYESKGQYQPWDGTQNGSNLPSGTYFFIVNLNNNSDLLTGDLTIIR